MGKAPDCFSLSQPTVWVTKSWLHANCFRLSSSNDLHRFPADVVSSANATAWARFPSWDTSFP